MSSAFVCVAIDRIVCVWGDPNTHTHTHTHTHARTESPKLPKTNLWMRRSALSDYYVSYITRLAGMTNLVNPMTSSEAYPVFLSKAQVLSLFMLTELANLVNPMTHC